VVQLGTACSNFTDRVKRKPHASMCSEVELVLFLQPANECDVSTLISNQAAVHSEGSGDVGIHGHAVGPVAETKG
jgi:hypothetical protein